MGCVMKDDGKKSGEIWTCIEVARFLRVHRTTVLSLVRSRRLRSYRIGTRRLFKKSDVVEFFDNQVDEGGCDLR